MRIIHYSLQTNHIHLIIEPINNEILSRGMRALTITFAKNVIQLKKMRRSIQLERYHLHVLRSVKEARNAVRYVLFNEQRHSPKKPVTLSPYSALAAQEVVRPWTFKDLIPTDPPSTFCLNAISAL